MVLQFLFIICEGQICCTCTSSSEKPMGWVNAVVLDYAQKRISNISYPDLRVATGFEGHCD